jgi:hypothetical protein
MMRFWVALDPAREHIQSTKKNFEKNLTTGSGVCMLRVYAVTCRKELEPAGVP